MTSGGLCDCAHWVNSTKDVTFLIGSASVTRGSRAFLSRSSGRVLGVTPAAAVTRSATVLQTASVSAEAAAGTCDINSSATTPRLRGRTR